MDWSPAIFQGIFQLTQSEGCVLRGIIKGALPWTCQVVSECSLDSFWHCTHSSERFEWHFKATLVFYKILSLTQFFLSQYERTSIVAGLVTPQNWVTLTMAAISCTTTGCLCYLHFLWRVLSETLDLPQKFQPVFSHPKGFLKKMCVWGRQWTATPY